MLMPQKTTLTDTLNEIEFTFIPFLIYPERKKSDKHLQMETGSKSFHSG